MENVTDLAPAGDGFEWYFNVKCNSCNEQHPKQITLNRTEERPLTAGKASTAHFVWKCTNCRRESSAKFGTNPPPITPYTAESTGQFAPILVIECRGLEFVGFNPQGLWKCKGTESGTIFEEVDLGEEGEWVDYDEKASLPVSIMGIESKWTRA